MKQISLLAIILLCAWSYSYAQDTVLVETFDNTTQFTNTTGAFFSDGSSNYYGITDGVSVFNFGPSSSASGLEAYTGFEGPYLTGEDIDEGGRPNPKEITWTNIDITNLENLQFSGYFAEGVASSGNDIDVADFIRLEYSIDGSSLTKIIEFRGSATNTFFREDTNNDGTGDGPIALGEVAQKFSKAIANTGSSLTLKLSVALNSGDEDFAIDSLVISGTMSATMAPEITVLGHQSVINHMDFSPSDADSTLFGSFVQGANSTDSVVYFIKNLGNQDLNLTANPIIALQNGGKGFEILEQPSASVIAPGDSLPFRIKWTTPASVGTIIDTVIIANDDSNESPYLFAIQADVTSARPLAVCFSESFEMDPSPSTYILSSAFDDGSFDFFNRYAVPDNNNGARDDFQNGWDQGYGIMGQDHDGDGANATQIITIPNIDISGSSSVAVTGAFGALNSESFNNYEPGDGIKIYATVDNGIRTLIGAFASLASASDLYEDTDLDGIGDGSNLTTTLTDYTFEVGMTGDSLDIEIEMSSNNSFEPLAVDHIRVSCDNYDNLLVINEVDVDTESGDTLEFIEIYDGGAGNIPLDDYVVVLYNGSNDQSYLSIDLDGHTTNANGYFVLGSSKTPNLDLQIGINNIIQNGADAIAIYKDEAASFPNGTPVTATGLIDAVVYDTDDSDDNGLLSVLLNDAEPQVNENSNGNKTSESMQRCPNGSGGQRNTTSFAVAPPTPGMPNECLFTMPISAIQGNTSSVTAPNTLTKICGVVIGDYQDASELQGFFVQEEDTDQDNDPMTSEAIFVFCDACAVDVSEGDVVEVIGIQEEFFDMSQLDVPAAGSDGSISIKSSNMLSLVTPDTISLPLSGPYDDATTLESKEGMLVYFEDTLTVTEFFQLGRYGQLILSPDGKQIQYTQHNAPDATGYAAHIDSIEKNRIILDDYNNRQNDSCVLHPHPGFGAENIVRGGYTIDSLVGVLHWSWAGQSGTNAWRVRPQMSNHIEFDSTGNPRKPAPDAMQGDIKLASFNVLNLFNGDGTGGGFPTSRGADSPVEYDQQMAKIAKAIATLDADIIGLIEIENDYTDGAKSAASDLVSAINDTLGINRYTYVDPGQNVGGDEIAVGFLYDSTRVELKGAAAIYNAAAFVDPNSIGDDKNRATLAQTFRIKDEASDSYGGIFTASVNHFKSKGSSCGSGDDNADGGEGNCADTRRKGAIALHDWLATDPTGSNDPDFVILGDLNSYAAEPPIQELITRGYHNVALEQNQEDVYGYVFDGQWGTLDYIMANDSLNQQVMGGQIWNINADESNLLDYNDGVLDPSEQSHEQKPVCNDPQSDFYRADVYRSSDHDIVLASMTLKGCSELSDTTEVMASICAGDSYAWGGSMYTEAGMYYDTLQNAHMCDSIIMLTLSIKDTFNIMIQDTITEGDSLLFGSTYLATTGVYTETFTAQSTMCDSTVQLTLVVESLPELSICADGNELMDTLDLGMASFADTLIAKIWIKNTGDQSLSIDDIQWSDDSLKTALISIDPNSGNITMGDSIMVTIELLPVTIGMHTDTLLIMSNDGDMPERSLGLQYDVKCPQDLHVDPSLLALLGDDRMIKASNALSSDALLNTNETHIWQAGSSIELMPGFEVAEGTILEAIIAACSE